MALIGAITLGLRIGRFAKDGTPRASKPDSTRIELRRAPDTMEKDEGGLQCAGAADLRALHRCQAPRVGRLSPRSHLLGVEKYLPIY